AIAAVAPVSPVPAIASVTATATAVTTRSATPAAVTATATTATTLGLRPRFIYNQIASSKILAVHGIDGAVSFFVISDFHEGKAARLSRETVANEIYRRGIDTCLREILVQAIFRSGKRKITDIELLHLPTPSARNPHASRGAR